MRTYEYSILIEAPVDRVWDAVIGKETYRQWTAAFMEGSDFEGEWAQGEAIRFTAPNDDGSSSGMEARIEELRPHEAIAIKHLAVLRGDEVTPVGDDGEDEWGMETYHFAEVMDGTVFHATLEGPESMAGFLDDSWPKALERLRHVVESGV